MPKEIPLQNGMSALVDNEDYERCMKYIWSVTWEHTHWRVLNCTGKHKTLHRFILEKYFFNDLDDSKGITFRNGNYLDHRKENLIIEVKSKISHMTRGKGGTSKYKGVSWAKHIDKWVATIHPNRKKVHLGCFTSEEEAARAYNTAALEYFGEHAFLNKIGENNNVETEVFNKTLKKRTIKLSHSKYRGVSLEKRTNKWIARIHYKNKHYHLGQFSTERDAAKAYDQKAKEFHGDKAILNFS